MYRVGKSISESAAGRFVGTAYRLRGAAVVAAHRRPTLACEPITKASASFKAQQDALLGLAAKFEPRIRRQFIKAVNAIQDEASLKALTDALATGRWEFVLAATGLDKFEVELGGMVDAINENWQAAGALTAQQTAAGVSGMALGVRFDPMNRRATDYARQYAYDLITNISRQTRDAIKEIVTEQTVTGLNPRTTARQIKQVIGLTGPQAKALKNYRAALESGKWGQAAAYSIGGNAERSIAAASKLGEMSGDRIEALVESYRQRLLRMRSVTIARTESMRAASNGAAEAWKQTMEGSNLPPSVFRRYWVATNDDRTRDSHLEMPLLNQKGVGMNEPFRLPGGGTIMHPHDPDAPASETINCRCCVVVRIEELDPSIPTFGTAAGRSILPK